jgi:hypothetical protein
MHGEKKIHITVAAVVAFISGSLSVSLLTSE